MHMHAVDLDFVFDSQQPLECLARESKIQDLTLLDGSSQPLHPPVGSRVSVENTDHVASNLKPTFMCAKVMARDFLAKERFRKKC